MTFTKFEGHGPLIHFKLDKQIYLIYKDLLLTAMDTGALSQQISSDVASDRGVGNVSGNMQLGPEKITLPIDLLLRKVRLSFESISSVTSARCSILWEEDGISCSKLTKSQVRYLYSFHYVS